MPIAVIYITVAVLFIGAFHMPYGYYVLLRIITTVTFAWASYTSYNKRYNVLPWLLLIAAFLFNPFIKVYLFKDIWELIDIGAAITLFAIKNKIAE